MGPHTSRILMTPWAAAVRFFPVTMAAALVGVAVGTATAHHHAVAYTAEVRLAVGATDLPTLAARGFSTAASGLATSYGQFLSGAKAEAAVRTKLGPSTAAHVSSISAASFPKSNLMQVVVVADDRAAALTGAQVASDYLTQIAAQVTPPDPGAESYTAFQDLQGQLATATVDESVARSTVKRLMKDPGPDPASLAQAQSALSAATASVSKLSLQSDALSKQYLTQELAAVNTLTVAQPAVVTGNDQSSQQLRHALIGAGIGLLASLAVTELLWRRRPRPSTSGALVPAWM